MGLRGGCYSQGTSPPVQTLSSENLSLEIPIACTRLCNHSRWSPLGGAFPKSYRDRWPEDAPSLGMREKPAQGRVCLSLFFLPHILPPEWQKIPKDECLGLIPPIPAIPQSHFPKDHNKSCAYVHIFNYLPRL